MRWQSPSTPCSASGACAGPRYAPRAWRNETCDSKSCNPRPARTGRACWWPRLPPPNLKGNRPGPSNMYSPTLEEFLKLAAQGNLIPITRRLLADVETPLSAYRKIRGAGESFLFESVEGGEHLGRYSFVGCNPRAVIRQTGRQVEVLENGRVVEKFEVRSAAVSAAAGTQSQQPRELQSPTAGGSAAAETAALQVRDGLEVVERVMKKYRAVLLPGLPRFTGGAIGFIGYEFIHDVEPVVLRPPKDELQTPVMVFL